MTGLRLEHVSDGVAFVYRRLVFSTGTATTLVLTSDEADALEALFAVRDAAKAWVARCHREPGHPDHPSQWADDEDFALMAAVDAVGGETP